MTDTLELLAAYEHEHTARMRNNYAVAKIIPNLDNRLWVNGMLSKNGSEDLKLVQPIEVAPLDIVPDPTNPNHTGAFAYGFRMVASYRKSDDPRSTRDCSVPMDLTTLQRLRQEGVRGKELWRYNDHRSRPAYYRALSLAPGFMVNLTAGISSHERPMSSFDLEILLAYRIMSKLVDSRDRGTIKPNGKPNRNYLFSRTVH